MFCRSCGKEIMSDSKFCQFCGSKVEMAPAVVSEEAASEMTEDTTTEVLSESKSTEVVNENAGDEIKTEESIQEKLPLVNEDKVVPDASVAQAENNSGNASKEIKRKIVEGFRKIPAKAWGIALAVVVAIIIICNLVSYANNRSPFISAYAKESIITIEYNEIITSSGKEIAIDTSAETYVFNYNNTKVAVVDQNKNLWVADTKKAVKVAEEVQQIQISYYGDTVVYMAKEGDEYAVYSYDVSKRKSQKIYDGYCFRMIISSNGKMVALTNGEGELLVSKRGAVAAKEYSDAYAIAISDDGKNVFYSKNSKLFVNDDKLGYFYSSNWIYFSVKQDEVLFASEGATYYYSTAFKSGEAIKVKDSEIQGVFTASDTAIISNRQAKIIGMKSFEKCVVRMGGSVYYVTQKGQNAEKIISSYTDYGMSSDGQTIIYTYDGDIYKIADVKKAEEPKKIGKDLEANYLIANASLKTIYYINRDGEIRYLKSNAKGELIADDLFRDFVNYDEKNKCIIYFNKSGEIYTAKTSKKSKQKLDISDAYSKYMITNGKNVFVRTSNSDHSQLNVYRLSTAKKVKRLVTIER